MQPLPGTDPRDAVLTVSRLRTLPLDAFAAQVYALANLRPDTVPDYIQAADDAAKAAARMPRGRRATSAEEVAQVYARARLEGRAPRHAVCEALVISERTADRYIGEARRRGLLAPYDERKAQANRSADAVSSALDPGERFEIDFEATGGQPGTYRLAVREVRWQDGGVLLLGEARKHLARGGFGVAREGATDLGGVGIDALTDEQRAVVERRRPRNNERKAQQ